MRYNVGVEKVAKRLRTTRPALARDTLRAGLAMVRIKEMQGKHRNGYMQRPVRRGEFSVWEAEQVWLD